MKEKLAEIGRVLWEEGLVTSHGGNLSVRTSPRQILITKTGTKLGFLKPDDFLKVPIPSSKEEFPEASSELIVHSEIYMQTDHKAVVHAHPPHTVALSFLQEKIIPPDTEGRLTYKECPVIEVKRPHASEELAEAVARALRTNRIVCVKGHGTFAAGQKVEEALFFTSAVEFSARLIFLLKQL